MNLVLEIRSSLLACTTPQDPKRKRSSFSICEHVLGGSACRPRHTFSCVPNRQSQRGKEQHRWERVDGVYRLLRFHISKRLTPAHISEKRRRGRDGNPIINSRGPRAFSPRNEELVRRLASFHFFTTLETKQHSTAIRYGSL